MWMFIATLAAVLLTAVGVFLIWRTLLYTKSAAEAAVASVDEARQATFAATQAAEAAREANRLNREDFVADKRAWIAIRQQDITVTSPLAWNEKKEGRITVQVIAENIGRNPAYNLWYEAAISIGGANRLPEVAEKARKLAIEASRRTVFPGDKITLRRTFTVSESDLEEQINHLYSRIRKRYSIDEIFIHLTVVGCIDYGIISREERRRTLFVTGVLRMKDGKVIYINRAGGDIPAEELVPALRQVIAD
jgi:hypothetical protein